MFKFYTALIALFLSLNGFAAEKPVFRLGVLAFGTVNWELTALKKTGLTQNAPYQLNIMPLATPQSGKIALQSDTVDMIVADWIWVSRLRVQGHDYTFYPYSETSGGLIVPKHSPIQKVSDLAGTKLGIAGGELDKNWLLLQALAQTQSIDLAQSVQKVFGAPPILNQQLIHNRLDAVLTYWHFAARLQAKGYRQVLDGQQILAGLGIKQRLPMLGYVFNRQWANKHQAALNQFFSDVAKTRQLLCTDDPTWQTILPLTKSKNSAEQSLLRQRYCGGQVTDWSPKKRAAAETIYRLLKKLSQNKLTGASEQIQSGTFWYLTDK